MAEDEIIKHTKKIYKVWHSKEHTPWQKVKEFLIEIFIIVFAVTVSIWLHNWSEHRNQQEEVKVFLLGLKEDLKKDIKEMEEDSAVFVQTGVAFSYITQLKYGEIASSDSLKKYANNISNTTNLTPNNGRFEGFKSSGKLGLIENDSLQNEILDLYQENIPTLIATTKGYAERKKELFKYIAETKKRRPDNSTNFAFILSEDVAKNLCEDLIYTGQIVERYSTCIKTSEEIIADINKLYPDNAK